MSGNQIRAFLAIVQYGNFTKAANSLYITEPALSKAIRSLEDELGCTLIKRQKGSRLLELTDHGRAYIPLANEWMTLENRMQGFSSLEPDLPLRIAATENINDYLLQAFYPMFIARHPAIRLEIDTQHTKEAVQLVEHNQCDLAFVSTAIESSSIEYHKLFEERVMLICPRNQLPPGTVHITALDPAKELVTSWAPDYKAWGDYWLGIRRASRLLVKTSGIIPTFITDSDMWAFAPYSLAAFMHTHYPIDMHELTPAPPKRICYALQQRNFMHFSANLFIEELLTYLHTLGGIELAEIRPQP